MEKIQNIFKTREEKKPFIKPIGYKNTNSAGYIKIK